MRTVIAAWFVAVIGTGIASADEAGKKILAKAIKAQGGEKHLKSMSAMTWKAEGKMEFGGMSVEYKINYAYEFPGKFRFDMDLPGGQGKLIMVYNNGKAWERSGDQVQEMAKGKLAGVAASVHTMSMTMLVPLLGGKQKITALPELKDGNRTLVGIKVEDKKHKPVSIYFDKKTMLVALTKSKAISTLTEAEVDQEVRFTGYYKKGKDWRFKKMVIKQAGKPFIEESMIDPKSHKKLDAKLFEKP